MSYPNQIAGNGTMGSFTPFHLFAGEKEVVTAQRAVPANTEFEQFEVAVDDGGTLAKFTGQESDPVTLVVVAQPIESSANPPAQAPVYVSAFFNHEALVWPEGVDTLADRQAAFQGTEIEVGALLGSTDY